MNSGLIGFGIGALFGGIGYGTLQKLKERVDKPETKTLLNTVAIIELITMPLIGYLIGAYVLA